MVREEGSGAEERLLACWTLRGDEVRFFGLSGALIGPSEGPVCASSPAGFQPVGGGGTVNFKQTAW